jgi:hypothetical protein
LCRDQRRPRRLGFSSHQLVGEHLETIERSEVARELRRQLLLPDDSLGDSRLLGRTPEPTPGASTCAFQIDGGDVACRCHEAIQLDLGRLSHRGHPNRFFRLSRPTF